MTEVNDLQTLLRSIASKMENGAGELTKDMLEEVADKLEALEEVAKLAGNVADSVPVKGDGSLASKVGRDKIVNLIHALNRAGRYGPNGNQIVIRRP
jgi:hypothetical protein